METVMAFVQSHPALALLHMPVVLIPLAVWSLAWKGVGLWFSARNHQKAWFVVILILNTLGVLEIIYLLWFRRDKQEGATPSLFESPLPTKHSAGVAGMP